MAVPFYIPDEEEASSSNQQENNSQSSSAASSAPNTPSRPIPIPQSSSSSQQNSPQMSPINNEMLVQAFYEALCRCNFPPSPMPSPSPFNRGHFYFPSTSQSTVSSPRNSFRGPPRRRLNSYGSQSQYSQFSEQNDEDECDLMEWENHYQQREQLEEFSGQVPQPKAKSVNREENNQKPKESSSKITSFVISALQFVIDTLR